MKVYTHSNKAHTDEVLACALCHLLYQKRGSKGEFEIFRVIKEDLPSTLEKGDFIVDIGEVYNGVDRFDHHQDALDVKGECAATLVAKTFFPTLVEDPIWGPLLNRVAIQDNQGLKVLEKTLKGLAPFLILEWGLVSLFETDPLKVTLLISTMIKDRMSFLAKVGEAKEWLKNHSETVQLGVRGYEVLCISDNPKQDGYDSSVVNVAQSPILNSKPVIAVYGWDPRASRRRTLFRTKYGMEIGVDLTKAIVESPYFCHKGGFLLTFYPSSTTEWIAALKTSLIEREDLS